MVSRFGSKGLSLFSKCIFDILKKYYNTLSQFLVTVESTVFGGAATTIEPRIVQVFNEARALVDDRHATVGV